MRIFVSGAAGFIGAMLCQKLLKKGYHVVFYDNFIPKSSHYDYIFNHANLSVIQGNLNDTQNISEILGQCDQVIHLAAISDGIQGKLDPELTLKINVNHTKSFILLCKEMGVNRFLFASTMGVYGNSYNEFLHEELTLNPEDPYSQSKVEIELFLQKMNDSEFITCSLRISMVYGRSISERKNLLVNQLVNIAIEKKEINIFGGMQRRPQVHIEDLLNFYIHFIEIDKVLIAGYSFNIVESNPTVKEIAETIKLYIPELKINYLSGKENEHSFMMSGDLVLRVLNIRPKVTLKEGIKALVMHQKVNKCIGKREV